MDAARFVAGWATGTFLGLFFFVFLLKYGILDKIMEWIEK